MKCAICGADNPHNAKVCESCGSNLNTRGGADILMRNDGTADHAGESRWKAGAGMAGAGALAGLAKFGAFGLFFKLWALMNIVRLATYGGSVGIVLAVVLGVALVGGTLFRLSRRARV